MSQELNYEQKLQAAAKIIGYSKMPPSIEEFIEDEYYLGETFGDGKLYPYWKEKLVELFPTPIHTAYTYIVLTGAIGVGKSTFSKIVALYNKCRLDHMKDHSFFGLAKTKSIDMLFFHTSVGKAIGDFINSNQMIEKNSPYFSGGLINNHRILYKADGVRGNNAIGGDIIFYNLSEVNFIPYHKAKHKIDQAYKRFKSRYQKAIGYVGNIIIDTSAQGDGSIADEFIEENDYGDVMVVRANVWEAKKHLNIYGRVGVLFVTNPLWYEGSDQPKKLKIPDSYKEEYETNPAMISQFSQGQLDDWHENLGWFEVYSGDSLVSPFVITDKEKEVTAKMDSDRIIKVPLELYRDFKSNVTTSLQDMAGLSTSSTGKFLPDPKTFINRQVIEQVVPETIKVDFDDRKDTIMSYIREQVKLIPTDRIIFIRYDIGVVNDVTGLAISYFDGYEGYTDGVSKSKVKLPIIKTPVAIAISRYEGQETSIAHLHQFVLDLEEEYEIGSISFDQFASRQIIQDLKRDGLPARYLSVDRTDTAYLFWKNAMGNENWHGPKSERLSLEVVGLIHNGKKVDHTATSQKDISDAVAGCVYDVYENLELAEQLSSKYKVEQQKNIIRMVSKGKTSAIQTNLDNYFKKS